MQYDEKRRMIAERVKQIILDLTAIMNDVICPDGY